MNQDFGLRNNSVRAVEGRAYGERGISLKGASHLDDAKLVERASGRFAD
jgi:hypothetical protein